MIDNEIILYLHANVKHKVKIPYSFAVNMGFDRRLVLVQPYDQFGTVEGIRTPACVIESHEF